MVVQSVAGEAERALVLPGDIMLSVNGKQVTGLTQEVVVDLITRSLRPTSIIFARGAGVEVVQSPNATTKHE